MPALYIITGSNGAGKSTVGPDYLPINIQRNCTVFDGDLLFINKQRELWKNGIRANKEAKKIAISFVQETFDRLVEESMDNNIDFAYEGHFTNDSTWDIPKKFREKGYEIHLIFFGLTNTDLSELRVVDRTKEGGHYVDPPTVHSNFYGNLQKLDKYFSIFNTIQIIDTSEAEHKVLCIIEDEEVVSALSSHSLPVWFRENLPGLFLKIKNR